MESSQYSRSLYAPIVFLILLASLSFLAGWGDGGNTNVVLAEVNELASLSPRRAMEKLDSIDYGSLSGRDKHYYDLVSVKVRDKAYITHESDSLILDVIGYYESHKSGEIYPEALYYGGRVYSDLGDYPTALSYFQRALDVLDDTKDLKLKACVLSNLSWLLQRLRLYEQAIPYLKESVEIDISNSDTINAVHDLQRLSSLYYNMGNYEEARKCLSTSCDVWRNQPDSVKAFSKMLFASIMLKTGNVDSALYYIRNTPEMVDKRNRCSVLGHAAEIYLKSGRLDTAYMYAKALIAPGKRLNRRIGYGVLLSPDMRRFSLPDTIDMYISDYRKTLEDYFDENRNRLAMMQRTLYNYQIHEKARVKAEQSKENMYNWMVGGCFLLLIMAIVILFLRIRQKNTQLELHAALNNIKSLVCRLETDTQMAENVKSEGKSELIDSKSESIRSLRMRLRNELLKLYREGESTDYISPLITQSAAYHKLQGLIASGQSLNNDNDLWEELEIVIEESSPSFKSNIRLLAGGRLTVSELHTVMLIKCGVSPSEMTILFARSKGAISSRRESICMKVFDEKLGTKVIDGIIRLL
ncbi:MAG: tetratricopeptide repeat protein [Duncaniella sp.]|nr:tetratricopeptide repeat protein [Duncaniella sp.]